MSNQAASDDTVARFVSLTSPHHGRLFRIALALCHDEDRAADLTQEALVRAFRAFDRFRPGAPARPWLIRILKNLFLDTRKAGRARFEIAEHQLGARSADSYAGAEDDAPSPLEQVERSQLTTWVQEEIAAMPPPQQQAVTLCDLEGMTCREAAALADVPAGTIRSRLFRGRETLRRRLEARMAAPAAAVGREEIVPEGGDHEPSGS